MLNRVIDGQLDGAHMLAGQPIGAMIGVGTRADVITAYSLDYNGNAITVSNSLWKQMQAVDPALDSPAPQGPAKCRDELPHLCPPKLASRFS